MVTRKALAALLAASLCSWSCKSAPASGGTPTTPSTPTSTPVVDSSGAPLTEPKKIRVVEGISEYELGNGLRVLLFPDASKDTVTVNVTYMVGSRHEGYGETGMAHLLEHMLFKGSPKNPDIKADFGRRGASYNASTWYDRTNYFETLPAKDDNLDWALAMEADRMLHASIKQEDLQSEFSVVRNEMEAGENDPAAILEERMLSTAYLWHNYGKSTIGARSDVEKVQASRLRAFYEKYYQPDNAVLVVAGKIDDKATLAKVNATFGVLPRPTRVLEKTYTVEPVQDGEREVLLRRVGDVGLVGLVYHVPSGPDTEYPAVLAITDLLAAQPSGRLYKALVTTGLATEVYASSLPSFDPGTIVITAKVAPGKPLAPVQAKMIEVVEGLGNAAIGDDEVARYKAKTKKQFKLLLTSSQGLAMALSEAVAMGDWRLLFVTRDRAATLTASEIKKVAARYLRASNRTLGLFVPEKAPERAPLSERPDVEAMLKDYAGGQAVAEGEVFEYSVANIEKRTTRGKLASGLAWAFLPKETRGDAVRARLTLRYGSEKEWKGKVTAAGMLGDVLERGTKKHTFQQIQDELDVLEANVSFTGSAGALTVDIVTLRDNLPAVLTLVNEILREPSFPAEELEILKKETLAELEQQKSDPQALAVTAMQRHLFPRKPDEIDYVPTIEEKIALTKAVKIADLKALHALIGASAGQLTIVGDFDAKALTAQAESLWGGWKSPRPYKRFEKKLGDVAGVEDLIDTPDKENALIVTALGLPLRDDDADYPALIVANHVLGGGGFTSRLMKRLREKEGWSYGAGSALQVDPQDNVGVLLCFAILAPQNAAKGLVALVEEVQKLIDEGVPAKELDDSKLAVVKDFERSLSSDAFVLGELHEGLYVGRTLEYASQLNAKVSALTGADVSAVMKKRLVPAKMIKVVGLDKKKAASK